MFHLVFELVLTVQPLSCEVMCHDECVQGLHVQMSDTCTPNFE
jgi:hypothetical protein